VIAKPTNASSETVPPTAGIQVPADLLDDCVDYVQFGAWTGIAPLLGMWNEAAQDVSTLRDNCDALGRTSPGELQQMSAEWSNVKIYLAASQAAVTTIPARAPTTPPTTPPTTQPPETLPPAEPEPTVQQPSEPGCGDGSYTNVDGVCVSGTVAASTEPT
jgi:hypothetical protein